MKELLNLNENIRKAECFKYVYVYIYIYRPDENDYKQLYLEQC